MTGGNDEGYGKEGDVNMSTKFRREEEDPKLVAKRHRGSADNGEQTEAGNGGKGSGSKPRGGKGGKGGKGKGADVSVNGILLTHAKLLSRLSIERRDKLREEQYIVEIPASGALANDLSKAMDHWHKLLEPGKEHELGPRQEYLWKVFLRNAATSIAAYRTADANDEKALRRVRAWLEAAGYQVDEGHDYTHGESVAVFKPTGKGARPPEGRPHWLFMLRFKSRLQAHREVNEDTFRLLAEFKTVLGLRIRSDVGPKDGLERGLEEGLAHLQLSSGSNSR